MKQTTIEAGERLRQEFLNLRDMIAEELGLYRFLEWLSEQLEKAISR